jgi:hypothetical protein
MKAFLFVLICCVAVPLSAQHMGTYRSHKLDSKAFGKVREIKIFTTQAVEEMPMQSFQYFTFLMGSMGPFGEWSHRWSIT